MGQREKQRPRQLRKKFDQGGKGGVRTNRRVWRDEPHENSRQKIQTIWDAGRNGKTQWIVMGMGREGGLCSEGAKNRTLKKLDAFRPSQDQRKIVRFKTASQAVEKTATQGKSRTALR